jgi:hypothetical protein
VRIIDFTGSPANGNWLEQHAKQAQVYTEKAGVNQVVIDSTNDLAAVARNLAFSLSLYTGQMCTAPQNIYIPRGGIPTSDGHKSFDEVAGAIVEACGSCWATRRAPSRCWARCRTAASSTASTRRAASGRSCSTRPRSRTRRFPTRTSARR